MSLQDLLKTRQSGDARALNAVIDIQGDRVRILLGAIGALPRVILGVEGDEITLISPAPDAPENEPGDGAADHPELDANGVPIPKRPPNTEAGEFVDDSNPLRPGENPEAALARINSEGPGGRQPETLTDPLAVSTTTVLADGEIPAEPEGNSQLKNDDGSPVDLAAEAAANAAATAGADGNSGPAATNAALTPASPADAPAGAAEPANETPAWVTKDSGNKDWLVDRAGAVGATFAEDATKADIADAINAKTGAIKPAE